VNHHSTSRPVFGVMLAATFTAALLGAAPVAASTAFFFQQDGSQVLTGVDPSCTGDGPYTCVAYVLNVLVVRDHAMNTGNPAFPDGVYAGDRVCYEVDHWANASANPPADTDPITSYEFNCNRTVGQASFNQLASATLNPTTIDLGHWDCTVTNPYPDCIKDASTTPVTISGTWTGTGPTSKVHTNDLSKPVPFCFHFVQNGNTRDAIPTVTGLPFPPEWSFFNEGVLTVKASADLRCM
jgi:hypothetical protein